MSGSVVGAQAFAADLLAAAAKIDPLMGVVVEKSAADLVALTQQNANRPSSGPPGPRNITGDYVGSWGEPENNETSVRPGEYTRVVGTNRAQARRLEYGYSGTDSIGRTFDQPPYPHLGPAVDVIEPLFHAAMEAVPRQATSW